VRVFLIDRLIGFWHLLKSFLIAAAASLRHTSAPPERQPPRSSLKTMAPASRPTELTQQQTRIVDTALLGDRLSIGNSVGTSLGARESDPRRTKTILGDSHSGAIRLVPRGQRFHFLMSLAVACHKNGVEAAAILAILETTNSEYCNPPKRGAELEKIVDWAVKETPVSCRLSSFDGESPGLISRGERYAFLMFVTSACHENGVEPEATLAIAKMINSECCHPPKREKELNGIVDWTARNRYSRGRAADLESGAHGCIPRGERHRFLTSLARTFHEERIKQPALLESVRKANLAYCRPPKPDSEVRRIVDWAGMTPRKRERGRLSEYVLDPCYQPFEGREKTPIGRPKALAIAGEKIVAMRGDASQKAFCRLCRISTDILQKAERGTATEKTISIICKYAKKKGQNLTPEELKIKLTAKSCGN
jgi:hypothetical protein